MTSIEMIWWVLGLLGSAISTLLVVGVKGLFNLAFSLKEFAVELRLFREHANERIDNHEDRIQKLEDKT